MTGSSIGPAEAAFRVGLALLTGQASADPDDPFESARGAMISAIAYEDPEWSPRAAYTLAMALLNHGDLEGARRYSEVAHTSGHPEWSVGALLVRAHVAAAQRLHAAAIHAFRRVIESGWSQFLPSAWFNLGILYQQRQEWSQAADAYEQAMSTHDREFGPKAATNLGFVLANYLEGEPGARRAFETAVVSADPEQAQLATRNLQAMDEVDRLRRAETPASSIQDGTDPSVDQGAGRKKRHGWLFRSPRPDARADQLLRAGERLEKRGDLPRAEEAYRHADAAGSAEAASNLGVLLFERGDVEGARAALRRADGRGSGMGAFRLGFLLEETGQTAEAERAYRRAVERGTQHAANNLAVMLRRRGDHAEARQVEQRTAGASGQSGAEAILAEAEGRGIPTVRLNSTDDLLIGMAKTEHEQGRSERAEQILREVVMSGRQSRGLAALNLGILLQQRGDQNGARQAYASALASEDRSAAGAAGLNLGLIAAADGDHTKAERLFRIAAESNHPEACVAGAINLGGALTLRGAHTEARQYYRRVAESGHPEYAPIAAAKLTDPT